MIRYATRGHMPFKGHRNQREVREDDEREKLIRKIERELDQGRKKDAEEERFYSRTRG